MPPKKQADPVEEAPKTGTGKYIFDSEDHYYEGDWQIIVPEPDPADKKKKPVELTEEELQKLKKRHGKGIYVWKDLKYTGEWNNDSMHGNGKLEFPNGDIYEGQFVENKFQGEGKFVWKNGSWYQGQFSESKLHGSGLYVSFDGRRFHGTFINGFGPGLERELVDEEIPAIIAEKEKAVTESSE